MSSQASLELRRLQGGTEVALSLSLPGGEVAPLRAVKPYPTAERGAREGQPDVAWFDTLHESVQVRSLSCFAEVVSPSQPDDEGSSTSLGHGLGCPSRASPYFQEVASLL